MLPLPDNIDTPPELSSLSPQEPRRIISLPSDEGEGPIPPEEVRKISFPAPLLLLDPVLPPCACAGRYTVVFRNDDLSARDAWCGLYSYDNIMFKGSFLAHKFRQV